MRIQTESNQGSKIISLEIKVVIILVTSKPHSIGRYHFQMYKRLLKAALALLGHSKTFTKLPEVIKKGKL
jgi:hypothetical protein